MTDPTGIQQARAILIDIVRFLLEVQTLAGVRAAVRVLSLVREGETLSRARLDLVERPPVETVAAAHVVTRLAALLEVVHELEAAGYGAPVIGSVLRELERATAAERGELAPPKVCSICLSTIEPGDPPLERSGLCAECCDARGVFVEKLIAGLGARDERQPWPTPIDVLSYAGELAAARVLPVLANGTIDPRGVK